MRKKVFFIFVSIFFTISMFFAYCHLGQTESEQLDVIKYEENPIQLSISSPGINQIITNNFSVKGIVTSVNPITEMKIYVDNIEYGVKYASTWEGPYDINTDSITLLDPKLYSLGTHNITVSAKDSMGYSKSCSINFIISNDLKIAIISHIDEQIIPNNLSITVTGNCDGFYKPFNKLEVWIDDENTKVTATINSDYTWNAVIPPSNLSNGQHIIYAKLYDGYSINPNTVTSHIIVNSTNTNLSVRVISPDNGTSVAGLVSLKGSAYVSKAPMTLELQIDDNNWIPLASRNIWQYEWDTSTFSNGNHIITIKVIDSEGKEAIDKRFYKIEPINIKFIQPLEGSDIRRVSYVAGTFTSGHLVESIELQLDGSDLLAINIDPTTSAFWSTINSTSDNNLLKLPLNCFRGYHTLAVVAKDVYGNVSRSSVVVNVKTCQNIAWVPGVNDNIQNVLYTLQYTSYMTAVTNNTLTNSSALNQYCWFIKNCDGGMSEDFSSGSGSSTVVTNLRSFINSGNSFLTNDNEQDYITNAFPEYMTYNYIDGYNAITTTYIVDDQSLQLYLGATTSVSLYVGDWGFGNINFNPSYQTKVYMTCPALSYNSYTNIPMISAFESNGGHVCYTSFHLSTAGPSIEEILKFIIEGLI